MYPGEQLRQLQSAACIDFELGAKVEARLGSLEKWDRAVIRSRRCRRTGVEESEVVDDQVSKSATVEAHMRDELQRKGKGAYRNSTLELYANSRR